MISLPELKSHVATLPLADRMELAKFLLSTLEEPDEGVAEQWRGEIEQRIADIESGAVALKPVDEFLAELEERYP